MPAKLMLSCDECDDEIEDEAYEGGPLGTWTIGKVGTFCSENCEKTRFQREQHYQEQRDLLNEAFDGRSDEAERAAKEILRVKPPGDAAMTLAIIIYEGLHGPVKID